MYKEVTLDPQNICGRLKRINRNYRVVRNNRDDRFEVHTVVSGKPFSARTIGFVVPYRELDTRTIDYAYRTRIENADIIDMEIEANNIAAQNMARVQFNVLQDELKSMFEYSARVGRDVNFTRNYLEEF